MRIENDEVLNELYDEEFEKIPVLFRFSKKRYIVTVCIACALIAATLVLIIILHETSSKEVIETVPGMLYHSEMNMYNIGLAIALFFVGAGLAVSMILIILTFFRMVISDNLWILVVFNTVKTVDLEEYCSSSITYERHYRTRY